jgi:hypothetical protein
MRQHTRLLHVLVLGAIALGLGTLAWAAPFPEARIFIEFNQSANDLGFQVFLDAENWKTVEIRNPDGATIFAVEGKGGYPQLGLTELFFEGAEPSLDDFPLDELLALFPAGKYTFIGTTVGASQLRTEGPGQPATPPARVTSSLRGSG